MTRHLTYATPALAAKTIADRLAQRLRRQPDAVLLLPAGNTPIPLFRELVRLHQCGQFDPTNARFVQLDEVLGVPTDHPGTFRSFLTSQLLEPLGVPADHVRLLDASSSRPEESIRQHAAELAAWGWADVCVLGIGQNGHIAFNEPPCELTSRARVLPLSDTTQLALAPSFAPADPPQLGMTLGIHEIRNSREIYLVAHGASKAAVVRALLNGDVRDDLPASHLAKHPNFTVITDTAAANFHTRELEVRPESRSSELSEPS